MKLYDKTIEDLSKALNIEKNFHSKLEEQIKELKNILNEETIQRDEYKGLQKLQRKQIQISRMKIPHAQNVGRVVVRANRQPLLLSTLGIQEYFEVLDQ